LLYRCPYLRNMNVTAACGRKFRVLLSYRLRRPLPLPRLVLLVLVVLGRVRRASLLQLLRRLVYRVLRFPILSLCVCHYLLLCCSMALRSRCTGSHCCSCLVQVGADISLASSVGASPSQTPGVFPTQVGFQVCLCLPLLLLPRLCRCRLVRRGCRGAFLLSSCSGSWFEGRRTAQCPKRQAPNGRRCNVDPYQVYFVE
jgi:hypothetical protein